MKKNNKGSEKNIQFDQNKPRPDERDNLDSRKNEEQDFKADDITHNKKDGRNNKQSKKETETYGKRHE
jgi:hypothetical protein